MEKVAMRLEVIEAMGRLEDARVVPFFLQVAKKDHSDVGEEATKQLGRFGEEAVPALAEILCWPRAGDFLKVAAAGHLARLKSTAAVPALVEASARGGPLVRISALRALAQIAQAHESDRSRCIDVLVAGLADKEGVVKVAAIEGLGLLATKLARRRDAIVRALRKRTADKNPMVADRARDVLRQALKADVPSGS